MKTIWKFKLEPHGVVEMPDVAAVLCVQTQDNVPCLWAEVDPHAERKKRRFLVLGTGHPFPEVECSLFYVGTFQMNDGALVYHVYTDRKEYLK